MRKLFLLLLLLPCATHAQILGGNSTVGGGGSNIYTRVQSTVSTACTTPCSVTVSSTGTGHLLYINEESFTFNTVITAVSGACSGSWVIPVAAQVAAIGAATLSAAYCLSSSSGATSITVTTTTNSRVRIWEYSATSAPSFDVCGTVNNAGSATPQPGVALILGAAVDTIIQSQATPTGSISAVTAPYGNFDNTGAGGIASADSENTSSGSAPSWTLSVAHSSVGNACAFK